MFLKSIIKDEIRQEIASTINYLKPVVAENGSCHYLGWAKMSCKVESLIVTDIGKPNLGKMYPSFVKANLTLNTSGVKPEILEEWQELREKESIYLLSIVPKRNIRDPESKEKYQMEHLAEIVPLIRGCEIIGMFDEKMDLIDTSLGPELTKKPEFTSNTSRTFKVSLDPKQYYKDQLTCSKKSVILYYYFLISLCKYFGLKEN